MTKAQTLPQVETPKGDEQDTARKYIFSLFTRGLGESVITHLEEHRKIALKRANDLSRRLLGRGWFTYLQDDTLHEVQIANALYEMELVHSWENPN